MSEETERPLYRIIDWDKHYEHGHSKTVDKKSYQHFPNRQDGLGYKRLVANKSEGERRYGCFCAMILTLSKQDKKVRAGWLTHNGQPDGERYTAMDLALMSGCTEEGMMGMLKACTGAGIAWVEVVTGQIDDLPPEPPAEPDETTDKRLSPEALDICKKLKAGILHNDPKAKVPEDKAFIWESGWGADARKLIDIDKRTHDEIIKVMRFAISDNFWKSNILGMSKLRKQYPKLLLQSKRGKGSNNGNKGQNSEAGNYGNA